MIRVSAMVTIAFAFLVVFSVGNNGVFGFNKIEQECIDFGPVVTSGEFYYAALTASTSDQVTIMTHGNRFAKLDGRVRLENTRMFFEAPSNVYVFYLLDGKLEVKHFALGRGSTLEDKKGIQALPFEVMSLQEKSFLNRIFGGSKFGFFSSSCEPLTESSKSKAENCECDQQSVCVYDAGLGAREEIAPDEQLYSSMVNMAYCNRFTNSGSKLIIQSPWGDKICVTNSIGQMVYKQVQIWQKSWDFTIKECQAFSMDPLNLRAPTPAVTELPRETSSSDYEIEVWYGRIYDYACSKRCKLFIAKFLIPYSFLFVAKINRFWIFSKKATVSIVRFGIVVVVAVLVCLYENSLPGLLENVFLLVSTWTCSVVGLFTVNAVPQVEDAEEDERQGLAPGLLNAQNQQIAELQDQNQELQNQFQELRYEYARLDCITGVIIICLLAYIFQDYLSKYI
uniref:Uncharacterized protein n=1 Tax=Ditylenchus dipsaci TaxID=166011 RepID=A0A915E7Z5_9BILA